MSAVNFHVLSDSAPDAHLRYSCRLAEQAFDAGESVFIRTSSSEESRRLDDLLWTYSDRTFLPHEVSDSGAPSHERVRILIGERLPAAGTSDVVINLGSDSEGVVGFQRVDEIVVSDGERKRLARERFKQYRDKGMQPVTTNV